MLIRIIYRFIKMLNIICIFFFCIFLDVINWDLKVGIGMIILYIYGVNGVIVLGNSKKCWCECFDKVIYLFLLEWERNVFVKFIEKMISIC